MNVSGLKTNNIHFQPEKDSFVGSEIHWLPSASFGIISNNVGYAIHHCFSCSVLVPFMSFLQEVRIELKDIIFPEKRKLVPKIRALEKSCCNCLASAVFPELWGEGRKRQRCFWKLWWPEVPYGLASGEEGSVCGLSSIEWGLVARVLCSFSWRPRPLISAHTCSFPEEKNDQVHFIKCYFIKC